MSAVAGDYNGARHVDIAHVGGQGWASVPIAFSNRNGAVAVTHIDTSPPLDVVIDAGVSQAIPPEVDHHVELIGVVAFTITFLRR